MICYRYNKKLIQLPRLFECVTSLGTTVLTVKTALCQVRLPNGKKEWFTAQTRLSPYLGHYAHWGPAALHCYFPSQTKSHREGKAMSPSGSHLSQWDPLQGPHSLRAGLGGDLLPQAQLPMAVFSPWKHLAIYKNKNKDKKLRIVHILEYQIQIETTL